MKHMKFLRWLVLVVILSLVLATLPSLPVQATNDISLSVTSGQIGNTVTVSGTNFSASASERYANVLFAYENANVTGTLTPTVASYEQVGGGFIGTSDDTVNAGKFTTTFTVPSTLTDGTILRSVTAGTYYIYVTITTGTPPVTGNYIYSKATFAVTGGEITISPAQGKVDSLITITGSNFTPNTAITVKFDGTVVPIESGSIQTSATGTLTSSIAVPDATAGAKTVSVTVGTVEKTATFTITPEILITPQSGESDATVLVSGTGFGRRVAPTIYFNNFPVETLAPALTDTKGTFSASFLVPGEELNAGVYQVEADDGTNTAAASFTLTVPPPVTPTPEPEPTPTPTPTPVKPSLTINSSGDTIGSNIGIGGAGFTPKATVTFKYDDTEIATVTADADGLVMAIFAAPPSQHGDHTITVSDGTKTNTVTYTVESVAPDIPPPLLPKMGVKAKSPATFDWEDVTDDSMPVTYNLQIAIAKDFAADSIVWEKKNIEASTYMLTAAEELKLAGRQDAFYWRVKAVDAASNESAWTGAGEFYFGGGSSSFPSWALYTVIGVGGVLLFGIGYWLGRRTAFYY